MVMHTIKKLSSAYSLVSSSEQSNTADQIGDINSLLVKLYFWLPTNRNIPAPTAANLTVIRSPDTVNSSTISRRLNPTGSMPVDKSLLIASTTTSRKSLANLLWQIEVGLAAIYLTGLPSRFLVTNAMLKVSTSR